MDSIGLVVFRCTQCSAGKSKKASRASASLVTFSTAFGHLASYSVLNLSMAFYGMLAVFCVTDLCERCSCRRLS